MTTSVTRGWRYPRRNARNEHLTEGVRCSFRTRLVSETGAHPWPMLGRIRIDMSMKDGERGHTG
jgi:hypothetical protein